MATANDNFIDQATFDAARRALPLVSIDLIIRDKEGRVLLGFRKNDPARNTWFAPGGRVRKDESVNDAFRRTVTSELGDSPGISEKREDAKFLGMFEHFYPAHEHQGDKPFSIHYVVFGYEVTMENTSVSGLIDKQHAEWRWFSVQELLQHSDVHPNTKAYFADSPPKQRLVVGSSPVR